MPMKPLLFLLFFCFILQKTGQSQIPDSAMDLFEAARLEQKPILLIFSGSDWCLPCIRFEKKILHDSIFRRFAGLQLVLVNADFPQRKRLTKEAILKNEALAAKFDPDGIFPLVLLLKPDKTVLSSISYNDESPQEFIDLIKSKLRSAHMLKEYTSQNRLMGSAFEFIVVAESEKSGNALLEDAIFEVKRLEALLTEFHQDSQTSLINRNAGLGQVSVDEEVFQLIVRCNNISRLTGGAFDITSGILKKLYNFKGEHFVLPDHQTIARALDKTGYAKMELSPPGNIRLTRQGMHIGFGAIGKGYAADKVKTLLQQKGVQSGVINASGDLTAWGKRANGEPWKTGIANPDDLSKIMLWLPLDELSVATSGNYIQYFDLNGKRYSHNIDPKSGYPVQGIKSVTVISPSAELSDALATAVSVMGRKAGLYLIDQLPKTYCIIVDEDNRQFNSKKINIQHAV
jgi:thiamine biosynthesis lipoprotein